MVRDRFDNLDVEKQEALLHAAANEFAAHGYRAASINRIIQRSGMSKGSVYYYFEDKADLFSTTLERSIERVMEETGWPALDVVPAHEYWETLAELTEQVLEFATRNEWWIRLARSYERFAAEAPESEAATRLARVAEDWWRRTILRGQELGLVRDDLPLGLLVAMTMGADRAGSRWFVERWDDLSNDELDRLATASLDLFRDMLSKEHKE